MTPAAEIDRHGAKCAKQSQGQTLSDGAHGVMAVQRCAPSSEVAV